MTDRLPNREAIAHFDGKVIMTADEFAHIKAYHHALAFTVAQITNKDILTVIHTAMQKAIQMGVPFDEFKKQVAPVVENFSKHRLKIVFHTNKATAYGAGQWQRIQRTKNTFPYLQYMPSMSVNKRDSHKAYYGIVRPVDDPIWQSIFPPNSWGCKCWVKQLTKQQAQKVGISEDVKDLPTPDFDHNHDRLTALLKLAEDRHGKGFAKKLGEQANIILRQISISQRNDIPLTDKQKDDVLKVVSKYNIDLKDVKFVTNGNTAFVSMFTMELLQIGYDSYPTNNPHIYQNANSILSMPATIAHELAGHRDAQLANKTHSDDLLEEVQASIRASMYGIDLTDEERQMLYQDALDRLAKNGVKLEDIKDTLWLEPYKAKS